MGAPRRRRTRLPTRVLSSPAGFTRRSFLRRAAGSAALLLGGSALSGCGNSEPLAVNGGGGGGGGGTAKESPFLHGVASGDPLTDRVILWTRVTPVASEDIPVSVGVYRDAALSQLIGVQSQTATAARDWTVKVDFTGLQPGTTYYYRFASLGFLSVIGRTRTAPASAQRLRFGVVSCSSYAHGYFNAYAQLAKRADLDVILHLGDYVYEYGNGEYGEARPYEPATEMLTLADYRARHNYYKRTDPDLQEVHRQHPFIVTWDDHETADNSWRDGANNHTEGAEGAWAERKGVGQQVFDEWMPIRLPEPGNPGRIFRKFSYGGLMDLIMLDTRLFDRDEPLGLPPLPGDNVADPARKLLGPEQQAWLFDQLESSTATWKFLGQQIMFGQLKVVGIPDLSTLAPQLSLIPIAGSGGQYLNGDQWDGYQAERSAVFAHLADNSIDNVVVLTGDIHTSWGMDLSPDPNNPISYNPLTGAGSLAVEYVCTSVTSPGLDQLAPVQDAISLVNPHIKYVDLAQKGYMLFDVTPEQVLGEWWYVSTIAERGGTESFATGLPVAVGSNHLGAAVSAASTPPANPPALAP